MEYNINALERLITKREVALRPYRMPCPPAPNKNLNHLVKLVRHRANHADHTKPRVIGQGGTTNCLSQLYRPHLPMTYLNQVFITLDTIGEGSFGIVYKARSRADGKLYAIKISKKKINDAAHNEIKLLEKIQGHKNLVQYHMAWEERSLVYIQMELCALSLADYAQDIHNISELQLWYIFIDMCRALRFLAAHQLVHLDVKPDNIMMADNGIYKLGDFGLLISLNEADDVPSKPSQVSEGDAKYVAPEVLEGVYTPAADVFSLGITLLELATDVVLPDCGPMWHRFRDGTFTTEYFKLIPQSLRPIVAKMMMPDPKDRPKAKTLLRYTRVKQHIARRQARFDYAYIWRSFHVQNNNRPPVPVHINASPSNNATPSIDASLPDRIDHPVNINVRPGTSRQARAISQSGSSCSAGSSGRAGPSHQQISNAAARTPPKGVSTVVIYYYEDGKKRTL